MFMFMFMCRFRRLESGLGIPGVEICEPIKDMKSTSNCQVTVRVKMRLNLQTILQIPMPNLNSAPDPKPNPKPESNHHALHVLASEREYE